MLGFFPVEQERGVLGKKKILFVFLQNILD
jgi:hypothetical protein